MYGTEMAGDDDVTMTIVPIANRNVRGLSVDDKRSMEIAGRASIVAYAWATKALRKDAMA